jgi:hypothetical protein
MGQYDHIIDHETMIEGYLNDHKVKDISLVDSFTWFLDLP